MKTKDILKLAGNPRFITGIYNYCDRWCERCPFTSHCLTYAINEEDEDHPAAHDINNEAFWLKLEAIFQQTQEMIVAWAAEQGIDLESLDVAAAAEEHHRRMDEAQGHELSQAARHYARLVDQWFEAEFTPMEQGQSNSTTDWELAVEDQAAPDDADINQDAVEVLKWYQYQISVKIMRAIMRDEPEEVTAENNWQNDPDGSIKVALIGMDRSLMAWGRLLDCFPDKSGSILPILSHLERLRRRTEQTFPNARNFIRPGFDTMSDRFVH